MYFSEGLMLVKVEMRHNGDARTPRKYRTKSLSANMFVCDNTDKEAHRHWRLRRKEIGRSKERGTLIVYEYTNARQTHVDSVLRRRYRPQNVRWEREKEEER